MSKPVDDWIALRMATVIRKIINQYRYRRGNPVGPALDALWSAVYYTEAISRGYPAAVENAFARFLKHKRRGFPEPGRFHRTNTGRAKKP